LICLLAAFLVLDVLATPTLVSISFDVERDPPHANRGELSFRGVEEAIPGILGVLENHDIKATFFLTGGVVERYPGAVRDIMIEGHEIGAHGGYYHDKVLTGLPPEEQEGQILNTALLIKNTTGEMPLGYRAPGHMFDGGTLAALEALDFAYDSSVVPGIAGAYLYGHKLGSPEEPYRLDRDNPFEQGNSRVMELPLTPVLFNGNLDSIIVWQGRHIAEAELFIALFKAKLEGKPVVLYLHPGLMLDLPNEPKNYRTRASLLDDFDSVLHFLDRFNVRYVTMGELAYLSGAGQDL